MNIDLHCHTTASDGILPPRDLVRKAHRQGLMLLSITDHDTTRGVEEALDEGRAVGLRVIPGVEVTAYVGDLEIHILGHFVDPSDATFTAFLERSQAARIERLRNMIARLGELGIHVDLEEVFTVGAEGSVGRPHLAQVLVRRGYVRDIPEAFDRYLKQGASAFVERPHLPAEEAIERIKEAGGFPTLAHPGLYNGDEVVKVLAGKGLVGLEVYHPDHTPSQMAHYRRLSRELGLLATGGSDYHGYSGLHSKELGVSYLREGDRRKLWEQVRHLCRLKGLDLREVSVSPAPEMESSTVEDRSASHPLARG